MMDTCGAKTKAGTPCKQKSIYQNGRCKFHGGMATGPITEAGKEQCRINGRRGGRPRKAGGVKPEARTLQGSHLLKDVLISEAAIETEIIEADKTCVSEEITGEKLGSVPGREMSIDVHVLAAHGQREIITEKPKSCMLKEAKVLPKCSSCEMLASNGACLAVAKGLIPCVPASETCAGFVDFEKT